MRIDGNSNQRVFKVFPYDVFIRFIFCALHCFQRVVLLITRPVDVVLERSRTGQGGSDDYLLIHNLTFLKNSSKHKLC